MWPLCSKTLSSASGRPPAVLDGDRAVVLLRGRAQHVRPVDRVAQGGAQFVDARVARIGEVERELVGEQRRDVLLRARMGLGGP